MNRSRPLDAAATVADFEPRPSLGLVEAPPPGVRARQLWAEARKAAHDQLRQVEAALAETHALLSDVADGGDLYAPGLRDLAARMADDLKVRAATFAALSQRQG